MASRWKRRLSGFGVDDGTPIEGFRYGGADTIHNTGTIDIQVGKDGHVLAVWFRCQNLAFIVAEKGTGKELYSGDGARLAAVEVVYE